MSTSPSRKSLFVIGAVSALVLAGTYYSWSWLGRAIKEDPLANYRQNQGKRTGIVAENFEWSAYKGPDLIAKAKVKKMDASEDRTQIKLFGVSDGRYYAAKGQEFGFEAKTALYEENPGSLSGDEGARVFDKQFDVSAKNFGYDRQKNTLVVPGQVEGTLQGGSVKAERLSYALADKTLTLGGIKWQGIPQDAPSRKPWRFETAPGSKTTVRGPISTFEKVKASDGTVIIKADRAEWNRDTDVLVASGHVQYFGEDANLTCDKVTVYRKEKRALLTGNVDMLVKPKSERRLQELNIPPLVPIVPENIAKDRPPSEPPDSPEKQQERQLRNGENIRDYPVVLTANAIEYWYAKGQTRAVVTGKPQARQDIGPGVWRMLWADRGEYDGETENLTMLSLAGKQTVRMVNSLGDDYRAEKVTVSTKEGDDSMDATGVTADLSVDEEDLPQKKKDPPPGTKPDQV